MNYLRRSASGLAVVIAGTGACYVVPGCSSPFSGCEARRTCVSPSAGDAGEDDGNSGGSGNTAGGVGGSNAAMGGDTAAPAGDAGGTAGQSGAAGADSAEAGMAGEPGEPPDCVTNTDCSNGATCSGAGTCVCSARFNGKRCEFQVFRAIGTLPGDPDSQATSVSRDGSIVFGASNSLYNESPMHAFRSVNGGALQFIAEPSNLTPSSGCSPIAADSAGAVLLLCEGLAFLYTTADGPVPVVIDLPGTALDISLDGKVIVGGGIQAFRKVGSVSTSLGVLEPGGESAANATNGDGSIAVGRDDTQAGVRKGVRWTAATGLVALAALPDWTPYYQAYDVSTDGSVVVGFAISTKEKVAVKWSGAALSATVLGPGQAFVASLDGTAVAGTDTTDSFAMLWNNAGAHKVQELLAGTPDLTADWSLNSVQGISDDGKFVVGTGTHGTHTEGWVAHLP